MKKKQYRPTILSTGMPAVDVLLGGGLPTGSVTLLAGHPGTGKTTLAMQWMKAVPGASFYSAEQHTFDLHAMLLRLSDENENTVDVKNVKGECVLEDLESASGKLLVIDSMNVFADKQSTAIVAKEAVRIAHEKEMAVVLLAHLKRNGELAGSQEVEHIVDACLFLERCDDDLNTIELNFANHKSRYCSTDVEPVYMRLTVRGMVVATAPESSGSLMQH